MGGNAGGANVGRYRNGVGHFKNRPIEAFQKATGETLHKGTINVEVDHPVEFREHFRVGEDEVPKMFGWSGDYLFEICRIDSKWAYRVKGGHPPNIVEIMSASWITKDGRPLKDGDELTLGFF